MIQANELRIENLVKDSLNRIGIVKSVTSNILTVKLDSSTLRVTTTKNGFDNLHGVELTPEILEKCGFVHINGKHQLEFKGDAGFLELEDDFSIALLGGKEDFGFTPKNLLKYLHQLQNLYFSLTGVELEVTL